MKSPEQQVRSYLAAIGSRDFDLARSFLADDGFHYSSPIGDFNNADRFIENISAIGPIIEKLTIRRLFVSESEVMVITDVRITLHNYVTRTTAMLCQVENEHIVSIEAIFDASEYHKMFAE